MGILQKIQIQRAGNGQFVEAAIVRLTIDNARKMIDETWWRLQGVSLTDIQNEGDSHWEWAHITYQYSSSTLKECVAIKSNENYIEGAVAYQFNVESSLESTEGSVYIGWLATAPHNRNWLVNQPLYKGIGSTLMYWVIRESYNAGLGGRISLKSLPTPSTISFYEHKGFIRTIPSQPDTGLISYELPKAAAEAWLRKEGDLM